MFKALFQTGIRASYNVLDNASFNSEPWMIYPAKHKQTGRAVSVFIFDKTKFELSITKIGGGRKNPKVIISECYELLKYEFNQLSKLKHPQILTIYEVLEETKSKFIFVSEPVTDTLVTVDFSKNLDELIIQKGLLQLSKSIQFLHNNCSIIHTNLQPSSVFITTQGDWKLSGFKFLHNLNEISPQERDNFFINQSVVPFANLNLNYSAPELVIDLRLDLGNDLWSFGCLIFYLYNGGEALINCFDLDSVVDYKKEFAKFEGKFYNHRPSELKYVLKDIPEKLYSIFPKLMSRYANDRMSIDQFIESDFFNGSLIKAMWFIDEFSTKSNDEKLIFLEGLFTKVDGEDLLSQLPIGFKTLKVLPLLTDLINTELSVPEGVSETIDKILSHSLNIIFDTGSKISGLTFQDRIYESLLKDKTKKVAVPNIFTKLISASVRTRLTLIDNISVLLTKLNDKQFVDLIKQLLEFLAKEAPNAAPEQIKLQESFLSQLPGFVEKIEFPYVKNTLFPYICLIFKTTTVLSTKLITIETFAMLIEKRVIDKLIVNDQLFPILKNVKSRDKRIVKSVLGFFHKLSESEHISLEMEIVVENIIPQCYHLAFGCSDCTQQEFKQFMVIINGLQEVLVQKKLSGLSDRQVVETGDTTFESLIQKQSIKNGTKDSLEKGPVSNVVLQPMSPNARHSAPLAPKTRSTQNARPSTRARTAPNVSTPATPAKLNFGATSPTSATTSNLLNSLHGTNFSKKEDSDDDFEDFQVAESPSIDWNVEVRKTQPMNTLQGGALHQRSPTLTLQPKSPVNNSYQQTLQPRLNTSSYQLTKPIVNKLNSYQLTPNYSTQPVISPRVSSQNSSPNIGSQNTISPPSSGFPPGFNASMVLKPNTQKSGTINSNDLL